MSQNPKKSITYTAGSHSIYISGDSSTKKPEAYDYNFTYNISSGRVGLHVINDKVNEDEENSIFNSLVNSQDNNINMPHENTENAQTDGNPIQNKANTSEKEYKEKMELLEKEYKAKMELQMALLEKEYKAKMESQMALLEKEHKAKTELLEKEYKAKMALLDEKEKKMEDD